jgi:tetratricopeptide (TPR) repeat protein
VRALAPATLLERLEPRLELLSGGPQDAPARQQTLRATLDWSHALLGEDERRLFAQLSVFVGGWDFEGAEAVADPDIAVVDTVASLVENSLVREAEDGGGTARYSMLETIREYAVELLASSAEPDVVHRRHAAYLLVLAERVAAYKGRGDFSVPGDPERRIVEELPNLRAALDWALCSAEPTFTLELAIAAGWAWTLGGLPAEGRAWMTRALDAVRDPEPTAAADAAHWLAVFAHLEGDLASFEQLTGRARELAEATGDIERLSRTYVLECMCALETGRVDQARNHFQQVRAQAEESGDQFLLARMLVAESLVETTAGDYESAQATLEEGIALFRNLGAPRRFWLYQLLNVGWIALHRHDLGRARTALEEFLASASETNPIDIAIAHGHLGLVALYEGDGETADRRFRLALEHARPSQARAIITQTLLGMSAVAAMDGDVERALRLWDAASRARAEMQMPLTAPEQNIVERYLEHVRASACSDGAAMSLDDAVAYALGDHSYV